MPNTEAVLSFMASHGITPDTKEFPEGTHTAQQAADAIGVEVGQIVKSLVFTVDDEVVIALVSGSNRLDTKKLAALAGGGKARRIDANGAKDATGYSIGGVPPFAHQQFLRTFVDADLLTYDTVWAAAGSAYVNFPISPTDLVALSKAVTGDLAQ